MADAQNRWLMYKKTENNLVFQFLVLQLQDILVYIHEVIVTGVVIIQLSSESSFLRLCITFKALRSFLVLVYNSQRFLRGNVCTVSKVQGQPVGIAKFFSFVTFRSCLNF